MEPCIHLHLVGPLPITVTFYSDNAVSTGLGLRISYDPDPPVQSSPRPPSDLPRRSAPETPTSHLSFEDLGLTAEDYLQYLDSLDVNSFENYATLLQEGPLTK